MSELSMMLFGEPSLPLPGVGRYVTSLTKDEKAEEDAYLMPVIRDFPRGVIRGVNYMPPTPRTPGGYRVRIVLHGKSVRCGPYPTLDEAIVVRNKLEKEAGCVR